MKNYKQYSKYVKNQGGIMNKEYKLNKEQVDLLIEHKNNDNVTFKLSNNDIRILLTYIEILQKENKQLKDNWNKLKEIVKSQSDFKLKVRNKELWFEIDELLSKMEELERGDSNE